MHRRRLPRRTPPPLALVRLALYLGPGGRYFPWALRNFVCLIFTSSKTYVWYALFLYSSGFGNCQIGRLSGISMNWKTGQPHRLSWARDHAGAYRSSTNWKTGQPHRLSWARDHAGAYCGSSTNWNPWNVHNGKSYDSLYQATFICKSGQHNSLELTI